LLHIQNKSVTEAELLKAEVASSNIQDENIAAADGYLAMAKENTSMNAVYYADLSAALYRSALARSSYQASLTAMTDAETALRSSEEKVRKYQQILLEISAGKGGNE
jgi:hypothetical protein